MYIHLDPETDYLFLDTTNCYCRISTNFYDNIIIHILDKEAVAVEIINFSTFSRKDLKSQLPKNLFKIIDKIFLTKK
jgi:hypothetical protein